MEKSTDIEYYSSIHKGELKWLWYPYIPLGKITLVQGDPGDGKSMFMLHLIACITNGSPLPDGTILNERHTVIYQCSEDGKEDTIKPRLLSLKADCKKVAFISEEGDPLTIEDPRIETALIETKAKLLIFDPIQAYMPSENDMQNAVRMRFLMKKLSGLAEKYNCAVVLIGHMTKQQGTKNLYRGLGSIDLAAIARSVLMIERDREDPDIRYIFPIKSNLTAKGTPICFMIDKDMGFCILGPSDYKSDSTSTDSNRQKKIDKAEHLLLKLLSLHSMPTRSILEQMKKAGISERTVRTAAKNINITAFRKDNAWHWMLKGNQQI